MIIKGRFNGIYYGEDVEAELKHYMEHLKNYCGEDILIGKEVHKYKKVVPNSDWNIPLVDNDGNATEDLLSLPKDEQQKCIAFWTREMKRVRKGYKDMCGLQYLYFNYGHLRGGRGAIEYRRHDNAYFYLIDSCLNGANRLFPDNRGWGIIEIGRRRSGKSSKFGNFIVWMLSLYKEIEMLLVSKSEDDAQKILNDKARHIYNNLPMPLKPSLLSSSKDHMHIGFNAKDKAGNKIVKGRDTTIHVKPCIPEAVEGTTPMAVLVDEIGKIPKLDQAVNLWLPALADAEGLDREGLILLTGVSGDMNKFPGASELWKSADGYKFIRWFSAGWCGLNCDEFGNEDVEAAVRRILIDRHDVLNDPNMSPGLKDMKLRDLQAQYPLTIQESFQSADTGGKFNEKNINLQLALMEDEPFDLFRYDIKWEVPGLRAKAIPNQVGGKIFVLEPPIFGAKYIAGVDAYAFRQTEIGSDGVIWIFKMENTSLNEMERENLMLQLMEVKTLKEKMAIHLKLGHLPVAFYKDRMPDASIFADRCAAISNWYWCGSGQDKPVQMLVDRNPSNILDYLTKNFLEYLMNSPLKADIPVFKQKKQLSMYGVDYAGGYWSEKRYSLIGHYTTHYCDRIYFEDMLKNMLKYDESKQATKYDEVDAFGNVCIMFSDNRVKEWNKAIEEEEEEFNGTGVFSFRRL